MKQYEGHYYETVDSWHPVVIRNSGDFMQDQILRSAWLSENCPDSDKDYDAWVYARDQFHDPYHRTIYFFRDSDVAFRFALRWS